MEGYTPVPVPRRRFGQLSRARVGGNEALPLGGEHRSNGGVSDHSRSLSA